jgi:quercetin dioxygenase-like cupin family protein
MHQLTNIKEMKVITPSELSSSPGPEEYFTGVVKVTPLVQGEEPSCLQCAAVSFNPGARSAWHSHPKGQLLVVTDGSGLIQEWGKPVRRIKKGDVIWTPPGVKHWHGADQKNNMTHTAIQESLNGKVVEWMEKVTDEQYSL